MANPQVAFGLLVMGAVVFAWRRARTRGLEGGRLWVNAGRWSGGLLLGCETAFLVAVGAPMPSSSSQIPHTDAGRGGPSTR